MMTAESAPEKILSVLGQYWKAVRDHPSDFTGWTYLLQYVEQEKVLVDAREAYDAFLERYPYCYGYWKKYADMEKQNGNYEIAEKVFELGVSAIPLSVDLWLHYITFTIEQCQLNDAPDADQKIETLFERAVTDAGLEFRSDKLWETYFDWWKERGTRESVMKTAFVLDRLLQTPTQHYKRHFPIYCELVEQHHPKDLLSVEEFLMLRNQVMSKPAAPPTVASSTDDDDMGLDAAEAADNVADTSDEPPPGVDDPPGTDASPHASNNKSKLDDEEVALVRQKVIEIRQSWYRRNEEEVMRRWAFEEAIRRPYFHVKPLEKSQLKNWREYLKFEMENGSEKRVGVLFERCVIACALYEEFWMKYAKYMETRDVRRSRDAFRRACTIHLPQKASLHLAWAAFEECQGCTDAALSVITSLEKTLPGLVMAAMRHVSIERRRGNTEAVDTQYRRYIDDADSTEARSFYSIKYARYLAKVQRNKDLAKKVLDEALDKDRLNAKLYLQLIDIEYQQSEMDEPALLAVFDRAISSDLALEQRVTFSQRKLEFLEDFGCNVDRLIEAYEVHQKLQQEMQCVKKHRMSAANASHNEQPAKRSKTDSDNNHHSANGDAAQSSAAVAPQQQAAAPAAAAAAPAYAYAQPQPWPAYPHAGAVYDYRQAAWPATYPQYYGPTMH